MNTRRKHRPGEIDAVLFDCLPQRCKEILDIRDMDLKFHNIDVLHFSGSQIFNEPFECAREVLDYIKMNLMNAGNCNGKRMDISSSENTRM